jgi:anthranilate synthase component 2
LIVKRDTIPNELEVTAWTDRDEVMGLRHTTLPIEGVQFHPESFLTEYGHELIRNWLSSLPAGRAS